MKKLVALFLVLALTLGATVGAMADNPKYNMILLKNISFTSSEVTADSASRAVYAACFLLDFCLAKNETSPYDELATSGTSYMARFDSSVDVYYYCKDGRYHNLFILPSTHQIVDYGYSYSKPSSSTYTYLSVYNSDIQTSMRELVNTLTD